jgi:hypothetical protein
MSKRYFQDEYAFIFTLTIFDINYFGVNKVSVYICILYKNREHAILKMNELLEGPRLWI